MRPDFKPKRCQKGLAMVETAVVAPLLLFLMFAVAEISHAFSQYNTLVKAAQDAARYMANHATPNSTNEIILSDDQIIVTKNLLVYGTPGISSEKLLDGLNTSMVSVSKVDDENISVAVTYPYQSILGGQIPGFGIVSSISSNFNISAVSTMRAL